MSTLSVVIIARNEEAHIVACVRSVRAAAEAVGGAEILVADSASTDRTAKLAREAGARVVTLQPDWPLSASAGRYIGFRETSGALVMFVDADTVLAPDWFRQALPLFGDETVGGVGGWLEDFDEQGRKLRHVGPRAARVVPVTALRGIGLYRRAALQQVGGFNPYLATEEEAELCLRLRRKDWQLLHIPHLMGCHQRGCEDGAELRRAWRQRRFQSNGRTLRYAWAVGNGWRLIWERFRGTIVFFALAFLFLLSELMASLYTHYAGVAAMLPFTLWMFAVALKRRNPLAPFSYCLKHILVLYGILAGALTTQVKPAGNYPR